MSQEPNTNKPNTNQGGQPSRNGKRHYREIGASDNQDTNNSSKTRNSPRSNQNNQKNADAQTREGGNRPPKNRRPRNRRPVQNTSGRPVERNDQLKNENKDIQKSADSKSAVRENPSPAKRNENQEFRQNRPAKNTRSQNTSSGRNNRWEKRIKPEETVEDIRRDIERIEKEIWLDIAGIHTIKLDF